MITIGIDPGLHGAIAQWDGKTLQVYDMPVYTKVVGKKERNRIDALALHARLECLQLIGAEIVFVEEVMGHGLQMGASEMGYGVGLIHMACVALKLRYETVTAQRWKGKLRVQSDKKQAVVRAGQLFPEFAHLFRGPRDGILDGRAEAAMIAMYGAER